MNPVATNLADIRRRIDAAAVAVDRDPEDITLIAVSKKVDLDRVGEAIAAGIHDFGENRAQEFLRKSEAFPKQRWHFIGTLQTNKVKDVVGRAWLIHSVDSAHLLDKIQARAAALSVVQPVLLQVNVSGEECKHGFDPDAVKRFLLRDGFCETYPNISVRGLMTMAPAGSTEVASEVFATLCRLRDGLVEQTPVGVELQELSMGMSGDFEAAIGAGATMIRIGTALFV